MAAPSVLLLLAVAAAALAGPAWGARVDAVSSLAEESGAVGLGLPLAPSQLGGAVQEWLQEKQCVAINAKCLDFEDKTTKVRLAKQSNCASEPPQWQMAIVMGKDGALHERGLKFWSARAAWSSVLFVGTGRLPAEKAMEAALDSGERIMELAVVAQYSTATSKLGGGELSTELDVAKSEKTSGPKVVQKLLLSPDEQKQAAAAGCRYV